MSKNQNKTIYGVVALAVIALLLVIGVSYFNNRGAAPDPTEQETSKVETTKDNGEKDNKILTEKEINSNPDVNQKIELTQISKENIYNALNDSNFFVDLDPEDPISEYNKSMVGENLSELNLVDMNGKEVKVKDFLKKGKATVLEIFRAGCPYCIEYANNMGKEYVNERRDLFTYVPVNLKGDPNKTGEYKIENAKQNVLEFQKETQEALKFKAYLGTQETADKLKPVAVPTLVFLNSDGIVFATAYGENYMLTERTALRNPSFNAAK